jgi:hypothetical protein
VIPGWWLPYVQDFVGRATQLYQQFPFQVTSFGRTASRNAAVGGAAHSQHLLWTAADLVPNGYGSMSDLEDAANASGLFGYVLNEGNHVHVQLFAANQLPDWLFAPGQGIVAA